MGCRFAKRCEEFHGYSCSETGDSCIFLIPNEQSCFDVFGEGPLAFENKEKGEE